MQFPSDLRYTKDHEWARAESDGTVTIGITDHAQDSLGEIVFVELPKTGRNLKSHETFGVVESIKAVSDLYCPVAGTVTEVNGELTGDPGRVNKDPYKTGWLMRVRIADKAQLTELMDAPKYTAYVATLK